MIFLDKTEILGNKHITLSLCAPKIVYRLTWVQTRTSAMTDWQLRERGRHDLRKWARLTNQNIYQILQDKLHFK